MVTHDFTDTHSLDPRGPRGHAVHRRVRLADERSLRKLPLSRHRHVRSHRRRGRLRRRRGRRHRLPRRLPRAKHFRQRRQLPVHDHRRRRRLAPWRAMQRDEAVHRPPPRRARRRRRPATIARRAFRLVGVSRRGLHRRFSHARRRAPRSAPPWRRSRATRPDTRRSHTRWMRGCVRSSIARRADASNARATTRSINCAASSPSAAPMRRWERRTALRRWRSPTASLLFNDVFARRAARLVRSPTRARFPALQRAHCRCARAR